MDNHETQSPNLNSSQPDLRIEGQSRRFPKKLIKILLVVIGIIAIAIGGYVVLAKYFPEYAKYVQPYLGPVLDPILSTVGLSEVTDLNLNQPQELVTVSPSSNPSPSPTESTIPDNWQTFKSDVYGFEIKYPPGWVKGDWQLMETADVIMDENDEFQVFIAPHGLTGINLPKAEPIKNIIQFGGVKASEWKWSDQKTIRIIDPVEGWNGNNIIFVSLKNESIVNQILDTFKFLRYDDAASSRDSQRALNINLILNGVTQRIFDNKGIWNEVCGVHKVTLPSVPTNIGTQAGFVNLEPCIVPIYLVSVPFDPFGGTPASSGYYIWQDIGHRIHVKAIKVESDEDGRMEVAR